MSFLANDMFRVFKPRSLFQTILTNSILFQPASSGRSAELLQATSGVPFMGFSTLKEGGFIPIFTGLSDELDVNINEDFRLVWKKMNKKDTTTKLKVRLV